MPETEQHTRRKELVRKLAEAALDLAAHDKATSGSIAIPASTPSAYVLYGPAEEIARLLPDVEKHAVEEDNRSNESLEEG